MFSKFLKILLAGSFIAALFKKSNPDKSISEPSDAFRRATSRRSGRDFVEFTPNTEPSPENPLHEDDDVIIRSPG